MDKIIDTTLKAVLGSLVLCCLTPGAFAETIVDPENYSLGKSMTFTVDDGDTRLCTGKFTGTRTLTLEGGGTLVLSNPANTFSGSYTMTRGVLRFDAEGASGSATVNMSVGSTVENIRQVQFNAEGAVFSNAVSMASGASGSGYACSPVKFVKSCTYAGKITNQIRPFEIIDDSAVKPKVVFAGSIFSQKILTLAPSGEFILNCPVTVSNALYLTESGPGVAGVVEIATSSNVVGSVECGVANLRLTAKDAIPGAALKFSTVEGCEAAGFGDVIVRADQHFRYFGRATAVSAPTCVVRADAGPVTLTFEGHTDVTKTGAYCCSAFAGPLTLVMNGAGLRQMFVGRESTMTGGFIVSNGTVTVAADTTFPNVSFVEVSGGELSVSCKNCFAAAKRVSIGAGATVSLTVDATGMFANEFQMNLSGKLKSTYNYARTIQTSGLTIGGVEMPKGKYTASTHPDFIEGKLTIENHPHRGLMLILR